MQRQRDLESELRLRFESEGKRPLAFVDTYGCQQNEADSEHLRGMLSRMGYGEASGPEEADVIVINTCAIREHAEQRVFGNVGALVHSKRVKPDQIIALCGCMMQRGETAERIRRSFRHVDLVFGTHALWRFPELLYRVIGQRERVFEIPESDGSIAEGLPVLRSGGSKAWVSIMYGCNNFCSYCVVPYVRGRERSRELPCVLEEIRGLVDSGYKDITLLGQNVNSYGRDLGREDFSELLRLAGEIPGDFWLRFMTSHPKDASPRLFETMAGSPRVEKHLHLPFQSGSSRVLSAMNRGYTREHYLSLIEEAKRAMPDLVLTSDVIVGFPGETEAEFEETLDLVREVRYDALFTFLFSPRPGTPASRLPDPVPKEEKQRRFASLVDLQNEISAEKHAAYVGKRVRVLVDGLSRDERFDLTARTNGGRLVHLRGDESRLGTFAEAEITGSSTWSLFGTISEGG